MLIAPRHSVHLGYQLLLATCAFELRFEKSSLGLLQINSTLQGFWVSLFPGYQLCLKHWIILKKLWWIWRGNHANEKYVRIWFRGLGAGEQSGLPMLRA